MSHYILFILLLIGLDLGAEVYYYSFGEKVPLKPLHETRTINQHTIRYYELPTGEKIGVKHQIIIGCKEFEKCREILKAYPVTDIEKLSDRLYLLTLQKGSDLFGIANELYHKKPIFLSHPNFVKQRKQR